MYSTVANANSDSPPLPRGADTDAEPAEVDVLASMAEAEAVEDVPVEVFWSDRAGRRATGGDGGDNGDTPDPIEAWLHWAPDPDGPALPPGPLASSAVEHVARLSLTKTHLSALRKKVKPSFAAADAANAQAAEAAPGAGTANPMAAVFSNETDEAVEAVEELLQYRFANAALLRQALTHSSHSKVRGADNERMEFFGDAVLDLVIREHLFHQFPERPEGELTEIKSAVVRGGALAKAARRMGLGEHLRLGRGVGGRGKRLPDSLLGDAFEALVAAIYLDGGYGPARRFILREVALELAESPRLAARANHKSLLQRYVQQNLRSTPSYRVVEQSGPDHARTFTVAVSADGRDLGTGSGSNKKEAEQSAARAALAQLGALEENDDAPPTPTDPTEPSNSGEAPA